LAEIAPITAACGAAIRGRLARSVRDARSICEQLAARGVKLSLGSSMVKSRS